MKSLWILSALAMLMTSCRTTAASGVKEEGTDAAESSPSAPSVDGGAFNAIEILNCNNNAASVYVNGEERRDLMLTIRDNNIISYFLRQDNDIAKVMTTHQEPDGKFSDGSIRGRATDGVFSADQFKSFTLPAAQLGSAYSPRVDVSRQGQGLKVKITGKSGELANWFFETCQTR